MAVTTPEKNSVDVYNNNKSYTQKENEKLEWCKTIHSKQALFFDKYAERAFDILTTEASPVLITGGHGTGKTSLVQHMQFLIDNYGCPKQFFDYKIVELDVLLLSYGIKTITEYEERLVTLFGDIIALKEKGVGTILFIDSMHEFVSSNGISAITHRYLQNAINANIPLICCCGTNEMKQLESKYDLMKYFTEIKIKEPLLDETKSILKEKSKEFISVYKIKIPENISDKIVMLSDKYVKNDFCMPLKAVKVMELAVGRHYNMTHKPTQDVEEKIDKIIKLRSELTNSVIDAKIDGNYFNVIKKNNEIKELKAYVKNATTIIDNKAVVLNDDDIYSVISDIAGVPVTRLTETDASKLKNMIPVLASKVIGQDDTITKVCKTVKRNRLGLRKKNHTIGNFMFIGSTGVGKTFLAKKLAEYMFGSEDTLIRLDMSEFTDEISVNKLIGAPPGYVGYGEGGVLCNAIKNNPYSVILFDEIEKAHPAIYNTILQLMDEGRITDSNGKHISATNNIVILTSNIGVKETINAGSVIGFASSKEDYEKKNESNKKDIIIKSMNKRFSPEFLNRLDSICYFNDLTGKNLSDIFDNEIDEVNTSVKELGYKLKLSKGVKEYIVNKSEKEKMGARSLIRNIQQDIVDEMTEIIINEESDKHSINVSLCKDKESLKIKLV